MTPPDPQTVPASRSPWPELDAVLPLLCESFAHRAELASLELEEAQEQAARHLLWAAATGALAMGAGFALTLLAASLVWSDPHRGWWLAGLTAAYLTAALVAGRQLTQRLRGWRMFAETRRQFEQDYQCLRNQIKSPGR